MAVGWTLVLLFMGLGLSGPRADAQGEGHGFSFLGGVSPQQEVQAGAQLDREVRQKYKVSTNTALQLYVSEVGHRLAAHSPEAYPFSYTVLQDDRTANAFAGPGGFVYITTGLINMLDSESQLAAVLGHESGHVIMHHVIKQMKQKATTQTIVSLLSHYSSVPIGGSLTEMGEYLLFQKFSRADESQADIVGTQLMTQAGYNPQGMVQLLTKLEALDQRGVTLSWMQSHPPSAERAHVVSEYIVRNHLRQEGQISDTARFHQVIHHH